MTSPTPNHITTYYLANAAMDDLSSIKAAIGSHVFNIPLSRPPSSTAISSTLKDLQSTVLLHGPALFSSRGESVAFGGNSILKAMTLLSSSSSSTLSFHPQIDEWLEIERMYLRHDESDGTVSGSSKYYSILETTLQANGGTFLVGNSLSAADIAMVVTLSHTKSTKNITPVIQRYMDRHVSSHEFRQGYDLLQTLLPSPPYDWTKEPSVLRAVIHVFQSAVSIAFPNVLLNAPIKVERAKHAKFGDYQCIAAVQIFQKLKQQQQQINHNLEEGEVSTPNLVAQRIVSAIEKDNGIIDPSSLEVNATGFIQCKVSTSFLNYHVNSIVHTGKVTIPESVSLKGQIVVVDFSSPNIAKDMHVGKNI